MSDMTWVNYKVLIINNKLCYSHYECYLHEVLEMLVKMAAGIGDRVVPSSSLKGRIFILTLILDPGHGTMSIISMVRWIV